MSALTRKQRDLLKFIQDYSAEHGICPLYKEMLEALDLKSKSGVHRLVTALERRGYIARHAGCARAIEVVRSPGDALSPNDQSFAAKLGEANALAQAWRARAIHWRKRSEKMEAERDEWKAAYYREAAA